MRFSTAAALALTAAISTGALAAEVNLYTTREPGLVQPLLDTFTKQTGIAVSTVFVQEGLPERVEAEGENSPADLLMTVDFGNLVDLVEKGVTQPVKSAALEAAVPTALRDPDGAWYALSQRARLIYVSKDRINLTSIIYEDLADPKWKGKVCIRSGQHPYNTALIAAFIEKHGIAEAETWLTAVKANLGRKAGGGDRDVAKDILGGICDIGVGNSYYVGLMRSGAGGEDQKAWGSAINVLLPTFADGAGTQVNISGAAVAKHAPNKDNAIKLLEFLASEAAQEIYAQANYEYPVRAGVAADPIIAVLGVLKPEPMLLTDISAHRKEASELVDKVGFDD